MLASENGNIGHKTKDNGKEDVDLHITSSKNTEQNYVEKTCDGCFQLF